MVFYLRQATFLAISFLCLSCSGETTSPEPSPEPPVDTPEVNQTPDPIFDVPELESIRNAIDPNCAANGCIQHVDYFGTYSLETLNEEIPFGVNIENGYSVWQITYVTHGRQARATITLPWQVPTPESGFHIVLNNPLTVGYASRCASGSSVAGAALAAQFGAYGLVGVSVDYPGLGTEGSHPYLVADSEAKSTLDGARATLEFLSHANISASKRIAFAGLSQGGHATLSAAAIHTDYAPDLDIRAFAVAAPSNMFLEQWSPYIDTDGAHLIFHALVAYAWSQYYNQPTTDIFFEPRRETIEDAIESLCLYEIDASIDSLYEALGTVAAEIFSPTFREAFKGQTLGDFPALEQGFLENRVTPFNQSAPIRIYQGTWDDTVLPEDTLILVESLRSGGMDIQYEEVPHSGHLNTAFGYIATYQLAAESSRHWLQGQLDP